MAGRIRLIFYLEKLSRNTYPVRRKNVRGKLNFKVLTRHEPHAQATRISQKRLRRKQMNEVE